MNGVQNVGSEEVFTVTNQLTAERPQVVRINMNPPEKPLSAYAFFFKETQVSIKSENPNSSYEDVAIVVETMWKALGAEQKQKYEEMSRKDRERYEEALIAYRAAQAAENQTVSPTPPPLSTPTPTGHSTCIRLGCNKQSVRNIEWEDEYCSNHCVVLHCDYVFREWVRDQAGKA